MLACDGRILLSAVSAWEIALHADCSASRLADRLLMATAMELRCPLVSYDRNIAHFEKRHGRRFGLAIVA